MKKYGLVFYDDGVLLYGAERVLAGDIPYKDFWFIYTPGNIYLLALIFKIFGPSIMVERILNTLICFFIVVVTFLMARKIIKNTVALIITIFLATFCVWFNGLYANQNIPILLSLISGFYFLNYIKSYQKLYLIIAGLFIGITTVFRQDIGLYTFIAVSIALMAFEYQKSKASLSSIGGIINSFKIWFIVLGSTLIIIIPLFIYFMMIVPLQDLFIQFVIYPTEIYPLYFSLPYPLPTSINNLITMYFPPLILAITSIWVVFKIKNRLITKMEWMVIFILLLGLISMNSLRVMAIAHHMHLTMITSIILFSFFFSEYVRINKIISRFRKLEKGNQSINIFFTIFSILVIFGITFFSIHMVDDKISKNSLSLETVKGSGIMIYSDDNDFKDTVEYVRENVPPNEKIFVGTSRHDIMIYNQVMLYFLSDRKSATRYSDMIPGVVTTRNVQDEIVGELKDNDVKYFILFDFKKIPKSKSNPEKYESSGVTVLDEYIKNNYNPIKTIGNYTIYKRVENLNN